VNRCWTLSRRSNGAVTAQTRSATGKSSAELTTMNAQKRSENTGGAR
jgi:hypothetical protein